MHTIKYVQTIIESKGIETKLYEPRTSGVYILGIKPGTEKRLIIYWSWNKGFETGGARFLDANLLIERIMDHVGDTDQHQVRASEDRSGSLRGKRKVGTNTGG